MLDLFEVQFGEQTWRLREMSLAQSEAAFIAIRDKRKLLEGEAAKELVPDEVLYGPLIDVLINHLEGEWTRERIKNELSKAKIAALYRTLVEYSGQELRPTGEPRAVSTTAKSAAA